MAAVPNIETQGSGRLRRYSAVRALFVINNPAFGGGHNEILVQRPGLQAAGWELLVATCSEPSSGADRLLNAGVEVVRMPLHRLRATLRPGPHLALATGFPREISALRALVRERAVDLVQVHGETNLQGAFAGRRERAGVCCHLYDTRAPAPLRRAMLPVLSRVAGSVTVTGEGTARAYGGLDRFGDRLIVTFPPVDGGRFRPDPDVRAAARAELGLADGAFAIGAVGMRNPAKGHDLLIEASAALLADHPHARVVIMGGPSPGHPEYESALHAAIDRLGLDGRVSLLDAGSRVPELLPAIDVFVMPSRGAEGMPTAVLEAMACELPVVATDLASVREEVQDDVTGLIVEPGDRTALVSALDRLARDPALRERLGRAGRVRVTERFTPERAVANRLRAWELALAHR
jgi:glycosyltransferase involved in cell wall biosynthesis